VVIAAARERLRPFDALPAIGDGASHSFLGAQQLLLQLLVLDAVLLHQGFEAGNPLFRVIASRWHQADPMLRPSAISAQRLHFQHRMAIPRRSFGRHSDTVSILGLGGYHLGLVATVKEAFRIVHEAIDAGVNFLDNAWEYNDGESERRMGRAIAGRRDRVFLMTKVCTHGRGAAVAMRQLEESLRRLRTDHLDLWQIHECVYYNDPDRHFATGGVVEALTRAKAQGKVRFVGFTGHKDPAIHLRMLSHGYPFDACQLPLNGCDATFRSFQRDVLPELARQHVAAIGMKSLGGDGRIVTKKATRAGDALRYAMSLPVCTTVSGIDSLRVLHQNLRIARTFLPMTLRERTEYEDRLADCAEDGRFELYKTSAEHEGDVGRRQHGFPSLEDVAM
jgi:aryl-alcohol dehydrogenase-like predicted oxidoreductase